jgi:hypothetical protein
VFGRVTAKKLAGLLNLGSGKEQRAFISCGEVVDSVFSYVQFPKVSDSGALQVAVAEGVMASIFGYAPVAEQRDGELRVDPALVALGRVATADDIDLGSEAFLLGPAYARSILPEDDPGEEGQRQVEGDEHERSEPVEPPLDGGRHLRVSFAVGKQELFRVLQLLPTLADQSESLRLEATIDAQAKSQYDRSWVRNAVEEPLEEADASERSVELGE